MADTHNSDSDVTTWKTNPAGMMRYFNSVTYTLRHAVADLVDNCLDAGAKNILIEFDYNRDTGKDPYIIIADDGKGIKEDEWESAMELGKPESKDLTKLATYGVGMKLSSLTQAQEVTIFSRPPGEAQILLRRISSDEINKRNNNAREEGLVLMTTKSNVGDIPKGVNEPEKLIEIGNQNLFPGTKFNTVVTLEKMHKLQLWASLDKTTKKTFLDEKDSIRCHLGIIYHRILEKRGDDLVIRLNGSRLKPLDPFLSHEDSKWHGTIKVEDSMSLAPIDDRGSCPINIAMCVIPHEKKLENVPYTKDVNKILKKTGMQGLYFYRNDRIIQYGGWHNIVSELDTRQLARCSIEIPPEFYEFFGVSPYKLAVEPNPGVIRALQEMFQKQRHWGKLYGSKKGKKPFTGKKKDYLTVSTPKATTDNHGVAVQRYTSEGTKNKKTTQKWKDNEDPFTPSKPQEKPPEEEPPEEEPEDEPPVEGGEPEDKHYRVLETTSTTDTIELDHIHPKYDDIHKLLRDNQDVG